MSLDRNQVPETYYAKHMTVDVTNGGTGSRVGNVLSSRMPIHVKDETGKEIHGFFTENEINDRKEIFRARTRDVVNNPDYQPFMSMLEHVGRRPGMMERVAKRAISLAGNNADAQNGNPVFTEEELGHDFATALYANGAAQSFFATYLKNNVPNITDSEINAFLAKENAYKVQKFTEAVVSAERKSRNMEGTHQRVHGQYLGSGVNKRNNAMSDYAELLGMPDLVAKSVPMTVTRGEQRIQGTFMVNAKGLDLEDISMYRAGFSYENEKGVKTSKMMEVSGDAMRDLSHLQVLDYLCANIDRHSGNMFYRFDTSDPRKVRLVGVQGIDNDASFGFVNHRGDGTWSYMSRLEDIQYIDAEQAETILAMKPEDMNEKIRLADLSEEEVAAANRRLTDLQEQIRQGMIQTVSSPAEWEELAQPGTMRSLYQELSMDAKPKTKKNIFYMANKVVNIYNRDHSLGSKEHEIVTSFGKLTSLQADLSLTEQMQELKALQEQAEASAEEVPGMAAVSKKAQEAVEVMELAMKGMSPEQMAGTTMKELKPSDRNELAGLLQDLADTSNRFAATQESAVRSTIRDKMSEDLKEMIRDPKGFTLEAAEKSDPTVKAYQVAKNIAAHAANTKQSVLTDSMEAEKQFAAKLAQDISAKNADKKQGIAGKTRKDYQQIKAKLPKVDSRWISSSKQFKAMMEQFNNIEKTGNYSELAEKTQAYLDYKMPSGLPNNLSDYAKARVAFAEEILDWTKQRNEDGMSIANFRNSCQETLEQYKQMAGDPEAAKQVLENYKEQFRAGYRQMLQISEAYPQDRQMQSICNSFLSNGPIKQFLHAVHGALPPEEQKKTDVYQAAGLDSNDYFRGKQIAERQQKLENPNQKNKAVQNTKPLSAARGK